MSVQVAPPSVARGVGAKHTQRYEALKRELGLSGNVHEVITAAAEALGVATEGKPLTEIAQLCARELGV